MAAHSLEERNLGCIDTYTLVWPSYSTGVLGIVPRLTGFGLPMDSGSIRSIEDGSTYHLIVPVPENFTVSGSHMLRQDSVYMKCETKKEVDDTSGVGLHCLTG